MLLKDKILTISKSEYSELIDRINDTCICDEYGDLLLDSSFKDLTGWSYCGEGWTGSDSRHDSDTRSKSVTFKSPGGDIYTGEFDTNLMCGYPFHDVQLVAESAKELTPKTIIVGRNQLTSSSHGVVIDVISLSDLETNHVYDAYDVVLFIDEKMQTKIIKNRYGDCGEKRFIKTLQQLKNTIVDGVEMGFSIGGATIDPILEMYETYK